LGYETEIDGASLAVGGGYIGNIADSDTLTDKLGGNATTLKDYVGGLEAHASVAYEGFTVLGGYMKAAESFESGELAFNGQGAEPVAWNLEAAYTVPLLGKETTFAATVQGTDEALALELPETRYGGAITVGVMKNTAVTAEYLHDEDYGVSDGGTGEDSHTATLKLAVDF
ncbi:MAG: LbtU family siderophore porin, partial [Rhodospirillales bacterium]|nr:LbtU family siderophore porin [Rhodospirillales bacterium]